jgi:hypothetical protein
MRADLTVEATDGAARVGRLRLARGTVATPLFMPVATRGTVRTVPTHDVAAIGAVGDGAVGDGASGEGAAGASVPPVEVLLAKSPSSNTNRSVPAPPVRLSFPASPSS